MITDTPPLPRRRIAHPGSVAARRVHALPTRLSAQRLTLLPGRTLLAALEQALAPLGATSAVLKLQGGGFAPLAYVMPALARDDRHAVYFSERHEALAPVQLHEATVTWGPRSGAAWLHCHACWTDAAGRAHVGHLLPDEATLHSPVTADCWVMHDAHFAVVQDDESGFTLFSPVPAPSSGAPQAATALAVRLAPNEDVCTALEALCAGRGMASARVRGGVGSTVGAVFDDGRRVEPFVTEVLVREGCIRRSADGAPEAQIDVALVDHLGGLHQGRLARGANGVLVTFEMVLEPD
jgi:predicted DNA-binding protein with PD1-like motif